MKNIAPNVMAKYNFGRRFHDLKYFGVVFFSIFLEFIVYLRATIHKIVEKINPM